MTGSDLNANLLATIFTGISSLVAAIALIISVVYNMKTQKQYKQSIEPQITLKLIEIQHLLSLVIKNTGKTAAEHVSIKIKGIKNNGERNELMLDDLFSTQFDLYPEEELQGIIAIWGENISSSPYPILDIDVEYIKAGKKKATKYHRNIILSKAYDKKVYADVKLDLSKVESNLKSLSRAAVRTANYLDGCQVGSFDELEIIAGKTLKNDISDAIIGDKDEVLSRTETIKKLLKKRH